ncbi:hypothetical protein BWI17_19805 [Betaproteobacteria bacterium GR16-43]|nr:hypothetical protein BWI17_19805 [Betaproteobacteria bacterium GR16-43]
MDAIGAWLPLIFIAVPIVLFALAFRALMKHAARLKQEAEERRQREEAMFVSMFPELQPYYHPENLLKFVTQRRARIPRSDVPAWDSMDGFPGLRAEVVNEAGSEIFRCYDSATGARCTRFRYDTHAEGGVIRVNKGKLTVRTVDLANQRVNYWHPNREFKWSRRKGWVFVTPMADDAFSSSSDGTSSSSSSSGAGAGAVAGGGGEFDGGGASGGWDDPTSPAY